MDFEQLKERIYPSLQKYYLPLGIGSLGLILIVYGLIQFSSSKPNDLEFVQGGEALGTKTVSAKKIMVDVEGAVVSPGAYELPEDSRIKDALIAAGGLSANSDRNWTSHNINLAGKLTDGTKIYVRSLGESSASVSSTSDASSVNNPININTATAAELDKLAGVGQVTAQKIITSRPYSAIEELVSKKVLTQKVFDTIKNNISVY